MGEFESLTVIYIVNWADCWAGSLLSNKQLNTKQVQSNMDTTNYILNITL